MPVVLVNVAGGPAGRNDLGAAFPARDAHEQGFHVTLPVDAMTDTDGASQDHSIARIFPRIAETGTTQDVLAALPASP
ncbi:hypothetical protein GCM10020220_054700 [Nonomuraea rubra]